MSLRSLAAALAAACLAAPALAAEPAPAAFPYDLFEDVAPHVDLEDCPAALAAPDRFCRLAAGHGGLRVFAFSVEGDQPMVGFATYPEGTFTLTLD